MVHLIPIVTALTSVVPSIAKWIGGDKAGKAATDIANLAKSVTGIQDPIAAKDMILNDPEAKLKFMQAVEDNRADLDKAYLKDRQDARARHKHSKMPAMLTSVLTVGLITFVAALMFLKIPEANVRLIDTVFGSYLTAWLGSCSYWFGTTRGSADKDIRL